MSIAERQAVLAFLAANPPEENPTLESQRARLDSLANFFPVPDGTEIEPATVGGVGGEWVRARRARDDAALLYLHGGGYVVGSSKSHRHLAAALSEASGLPVFVADYRLAPENPFPAAVDDAVAAYKGLLDAGLRPERLAIAGDSAGGGLTLAALVALRERGLPMPACAAGLSAWTDLSASNPSHQTRRSRDPMVGMEGLKAMAAQYLGGADAKTPLASPQFADLAGLPPLLLQVGGDEVLHDDTMVFKDRAEEAGVQVSAESWGGMVHVWHVFHPILSEGRAAIARIGQFLKVHIG